MPGMKKRLFATLVWFYAAWYGGAVIAYFLDVSPLLGPVMGIAAAALIGIDPRGRVWVTKKATQPTTQVQHQAV